MTRSMQVVFAVTLGLLAAPALLWAADASPAMLGNACAPCHGTDGKSPGAIPSHCPASQPTTSSSACSNSRPAVARAR